MVVAEAEETLAEFVRRRKQLDIDQRVIENKWRLPSGRRILPSGSLGAIEDGRIKVTPEFAKTLSGVLDLVEEEGKKKEVAA